MECHQTLDEISKAKELNQRSAIGEGKGVLKIALHTDPIDQDANSIFGSSKNHQWSFSSKTCLVRIIGDSFTKDINLSIKANGLAAKDYEKGIALDTLDSIEK